MHLHHAAIVAGLLALVPLPAAAQQARVVPSCAGVTLRPGDSANLMVDLSGGLCTAGSSAGGGIVGVTRSRLTCTLPAYASGGNIVCTDSAGGQTTTACAANTACLVAAADPARKTAFATVRTAGVTCDVGYSATVAPGNAIGVDGPGTAGGQGSSVSETPAHVGPYHAACSGAATLVFVQGQ